MSDDYPILRRVPLGLGTHMSPPTPCKLLRIGWYYTGTTPREGWGVDGGWRVAGSRGD